MKPKLYIYAASANIWPVDQHPLELKQLVKELWGKSYRRICHFIELALVGAKRCVTGTSVPIEPDCDLVFASGQGNVSQVVKVTQQIFKEHQPPMPFDFMHIPNNMAPFYVAQALELNSSNLTVAHRAFPFETAVDLVCMSSAPGKQYLIGAVDECAFPLEQHRLRLNLPADTLLAEGSHWLLTGGDVKHAIAQVEFCIFASSLDDLLLCLAEQDTGANSTLACGFGINVQEQQALSQQLNLKNTYDYRQVAAYHDTAAAYAIASFIDSSTDEQRIRTLIHINKSSQQRYCAIAVTVL